MENRQCNNAAHFLRKQLQTKRLELSYHSFLVLDVTTFCKGKQRLI